jgi:NTE family protein
MTTALVLSGGGARAAYQVGVLKAVSQLLPRSTHNPFKIVCGTSAGAMNALAIAGRPGPLRLRIRKLESVWSNLRAQDIYRTDGIGVSKNTLRLLFSLLHSGYSAKRPLGLLDNSPLRKLLDQLVRFRYIDEAIASGELIAVATTSMDYGTGRSVSFFQGNHETWQRARRLGIRTGLTIDHLMASSAIPTIFPATSIDQSYYGDGAVRQLKPLSPALRLGAKKLFIVGVSDNPANVDPIKTLTHPPSLAQMVSQLLNSAFIDSIESDLETLIAINKLAKEIPEQAATKNLRHVDYLCISPSVAIDEITAQYIHELPASLRFFLRATGASSKGGGLSTASYLLFEPGFCRELLELGYKDAMRQQDQILPFFGFGTDQYAVS